MTPSAGVTSRRREVLDRIADDVLAEEAETVRRRTEVEAAEEAERKRREELTAKRDKLVEERLEALSAAEASCRSMVAAMHKVRSCGGELATVYVALGDHCQTGLAGESAMRSLGDKLSAALRSLANNGGRFGGVTLARSWRQPDQPWAEDAIARVGRTETRSE